MSTATRIQAGFDAEERTPTAFERVLLTFTAPSRAFAHLGSGGSWWLPYLLIVVIGSGFVATIGSKVGWETVARNNLANSPKQQARMDQVPPAQQTQQIAIIARITRITAYIVPVLSPLIVGAVVAALLLATFNFALGGQARFGPLFAVYMFAALPQALKALVGIATLFLGLSGEEFQMNNATGSNPAFYLQGSGAPLWATSLLTWADIFVIWQLTILIIGCSMAASVTRGKAAVAVLGWAAVVALVGAAMTLAA